MNQELKGIQESLNFIESAIRELNITLLEGFGKVCEVNQLPLPTPKLCRNCECWQKECFTATLVPETCEEYREKRPEGPPRTPTASLMQTSILRTLLSIKMWIRKWMM